MIPVARPAILSEMSSAAEAVLDSRWLGLGKVTEEFEEKISQRLGGRPVLAVNTGTTAMHLALKVAGIGPGDDVVLPALTFAATAQAVLAAGAQPVLCDVNSESLNVDVDCLEQALTPQTRAVMPVHYRGLPVEIDQILDWANSRGVRVIEDAAHAFGSNYLDGSAVGSSGDITCFSFDPIKNITSGEGGCIVFANEDEHSRARKMSVLGIDSSAWSRTETQRPWNYDVIDDGFRYHMPNLCAAIGIVQLEHLDQLRSRKQEVLSTYQEAFSSLESISMPEMPADQVFPFLALLLVEERDQFMAHMKESGVGTGVHYIPLHHLTRFQDMAAHELKVTDTISDRICSIPLLSDQTEKEVEQVLGAVRSFAAKVSVAA